MNKDILKTGALAIVALVVIFGAARIVGSLDLSQGSDIQQKEESTGIVASRDVVSSVVFTDSETGETMVSYGYRGDPLPAKLAPDEVVAARTGSSYTRKIATRNAGTPDAVYTLNTVAYPRPQFLQDGTNWYYLNYAITTKKNFDAAKKGISFFSPFIQTAFAESATIFSGSGDGFIDVAGDLNWNTPPCANGSFGLGTCTGAHDATSTANTGGGTINSSAATATTTTAFVSAKSST